VEVLQPKNDREHVVFLESIAARLVLQHGCVIRNDPASWCEPCGLFWIGLEYWRNLTPALDGVIGPQRRSRWMEHATRYRHPDSGTCRECGFEPEVFRQAVRAALAKIGASLEKRPIQRSPSGPPA
jgi:hypothetical protein